jgi:hypothetical protein
MVPITSNHKYLLGPVSSLLSIRCDEIGRREEIFRQRNGSKATLPDFSVILNKEDAQDQGSSD